MVACMEGSARSRLVLHDGEGQVTLLGAASGSVPLTVPEIAAAVVVHLLGISPADIGAGLATHER
jgi:hypothetical protein